MKLKFLILLLTVFGHSLFAQESSELTITVEGLESRKGSLRIGLYNKSEGFTKPGFAIDGAVVEVTEDVAEYTFRVAAADYAVAIYHDANNDDKLNTNMVGYPKENYGFSNNAFGNFGGVPKFEAAKVRVAENETKEIVVTLR
ncbi:MAG: DUF2141 domain-containing protein [Saprospiraceae bacterium]